MTLASVRSSVPIWPGASDSHCAWLSLPRCVYKQLGALEAMDILSGHAEPAVGSDGLSFACSPCSGCSWLSSTGAASECEHPPACLRGSLGPRRRRTLASLRCYGATSAQGTTSTVLCQAPGRRGLDATQMRSATWRSTRLMSARCSREPGHGDMGFEHTADTRCCVLLLH